MPDIKPPPMTRRSLLAGASVAPLTPLYGPRAPDLTARCSAWLAASFETDRLTLRWSRLETLVLRGPGSSRRAASVAQMAEIEARLAVLDDARDRGLEALAKHPARTVHEVASKLAVAARMLDGEGGPVHDIVAEAVVVLETLNGPSVAT